MGPIQSSLELMLENNLTTKLYLIHAIKNHSRDIGLKPTESSIEKLVSGIIEGNSDIEFTDAEEKEFGDNETQVKTNLEKIFAAIIENQEEIYQDIAKIIHEAVNSTLHSCADIIHKEIKALSGDILRQARLQQAQSGEDARKIWGDSLDQSRIYLHLLSEFINNPILVGKESNEELKRVVLTSISNRILTTANEILLLIESGFPDGALARWRSLHEATVIGIFIFQNHKNCAEAFFEHQQIQEHIYRSADFKRFTTISHDYRRNKEYSRLTKEKSRLTLKYGEKFYKQYGWSINYIKDKSPSFKAIEKEVDLDHLRVSYERACEAVHTGSHGTFTPPTLYRSIVNREIETNITGLMIPLQQLIHSLSIYIASIVVNSNDADIITKSLALNKISFDIISNIENKQSMLARKSSKI